MRQPVLGFIMPMQFGLSALRFAERAENSADVTFLVGETCARYLVAGPLPTPLSSDTAHRLEDALGELPTLTMQHRLFVDAGGLVSWRVKNEAALDRCIERTLQLTLPLDDSTRNRIPICRLRDLSYRSAVEEIFHNEESYQPLGFVIGAVGLHNEFTILYTEHREVKVRT